MVQRESSAKNLAGPRLRRRRARGDLRGVGASVRFIGAFVASYFAVGRPSCWLAPEPSGPSRRAAAAALLGALGGASAADAKPMEELYMLDKSADGKDTYMRYDADGNIVDTVRAKIRTRVVRGPVAAPEFCRAATDGDLLSIRYAAAYELEGGQAAAEAAREEDEPADYVITRPTIVSTSKELGGDRLGEIPVGTEVKILEVDKREGDQRVRGRIAGPDGWISLKNTQDGTRWAQKMVDEPLLDLIARPRSPGPRWKVYDTSDKRAPGMPYRLPLGDNIAIPGVDIGLHGMCEGEKRVLYVPSALGYGDKGSSLFGVPPNANLRYDVELTNVLAMPRRGSVQDTSRKIQGEQIP